MPKDCNPLYPMIFGGALWSRMDMAAHTCTMRLLHHSKCNQAVTYKSNVTFHAAAECGDIVFIYCTVTQLRRKGIGIKVEVQREKSGEPGCLKVAEAEFVFCSKKDGKFIHHELKLDN